MMNKKKITISMLLMVASMLLLSACVSGDGNGNGNGSGDGGLVCPGDPASPPGLTCPGDPGCPIVSIGGALRRGEFPGGRNTQIEHDGGGLDNDNRRDDQFGYAIANLGDLNNSMDGTIEVAVGAPGEKSGSFGTTVNGGGGEGAIFIHSLGTNGNVTGTVQKIGNGSGGISCLPNRISFGAAIAAIGNRNGDDIGDIAVGAPGFGQLSSCGLTGGKRDSGALYILYMNDDGTVKTSPSPVILADGRGLSLKEAGFFGSAVAYLGDLDGAGDSEYALAVGASGENTCFFSGTTSQGSAQLLEVGAVYILFMDADETIQKTVRIGNSVVRSGFQGSPQFPSGLECGVTSNMEPLEPGGRFGSALAAADLNGDGRNELIVGARGGHTHTEIDFCYSWPTNYVRQTLRTPVRKPSAKSGYCF